MRKMYMPPETVSMTFHIMSLLEGSLNKEESDDDWQGAKSVFDDDDIKDEDILIKNLWEE